MTELDVNVSLGGAIAVPVLDTSAGQRVASGKCALAGWSVRTVATQTSAETQGQANAPAANTAIATLLVPAGEWVITWTVMVNGTVGAPEVNNFQLLQAGVLLLGSENGNTANQPYQQMAVTISVPAGGQNVTINNVILATVGSVYFAELAASPVGGVAIAELTSGSNVVAEIALAVGQADTHWFGSGGIEMPSDLTLAVRNGSMRGAVYVRLE